MEGLDQQLPLTVELRGFRAASKLTPSDRAKLALWCAEQVHSLVPLAEKALCDGKLAWLLVRLENEECGLLARKRGRWTFAPAELEELFARLPETQRSSARAIAAPRNRAAMKSI